MDEVTITCMFIVQCLHYFSAFLFFMVTLCSELFFKTFVCLFIHHLKHYGKFYLKHLKHLLKMELGWTSMFSCIKFTLYFIIVLNI